jgi:Tfp pilus assembly protein PilO
MSGILVVMILAFILAIYVPHSREMGTLAKEIASHKQDLRTDAKLASVVPALIKRVDELSAKYKHFNRRLPEHVDVGAFFREMSANVAEERLPKPDMQVRSPVNEGLYQTLPIQIKMRGNYLALGNLLKRLDRMERLTLVERLELKALPDSADIDITLLVNIYHTTQETNETHEQDRTDASQLARSPAF